MIIIIFCFFLVNKRKTYRYEATCAQKPRKLHKTRELYPSLKLCKFLAEEHIGKPSASSSSTNNDNNNNNSVSTTTTYPITLRFIIDHQTYNALRANGATFRQPLMVRTLFVCLSARKINSLLVVACRLECNGSVS